MLDPPGGTGQRWCSVGPLRRPWLTASCARGVVWGGSKPERDPGRLHSLVHDRQQLVREGIEVDLVAQAGGEHLDCRSRVVVASVEAAVNHLLDAAPGRLEQRGHGQGRSGHDQAGLSPEELAQP